MAKNINSTGFSVVEMLIILAVTALIVMAGAFIYEQHNKNNTESIKSSADIRLIVKRDNPLNQPGVGIFSKVVSATSATAILNDINSLKSVPKGTYNCPNDDGVEYTFDFTNPTLSAKAAASGCQIVTANDKSYQSTDKFWKDVSRATQQPIDPNKSFQ